VIAQGASRLSAARRQQEQQLVLERPQRDAATTIGISRARGQAGDVARGRVTAASSTTTPIALVPALRPCAATS
jgi:hypothetical protein